MFIFNLIHFIAGFVFAVVDTDQFRAELNPFTLDTVFGVSLVFKAYTWAFTFYFCWPAAKYLRLRQRVWWKPVAAGIGAYALYAAVRMLFDGYLFQPFQSLEIRNVIMLGLVAATLTNPVSWTGWFKPFTSGAGVAFAIRAICHFVGERQDTSAMLGADTLGFYGAFGIHVVILVTVGTVAAVWFWEKRQWRWMAASVTVTLVFLAVVASGFRRGAILQAVLIPICAVGIAFWLRRESARGALISLIILLFAAGSVSAVAIGAFGAGPAWDRLLSLIKPTEQSLALDSNLSYMDDWVGFGEVMEKHPFGVGYGNSYGVARYVETSSKEIGDADTEPPLHVGPFDMVARTGPFGVLALLGLIWTTLRVLYWMRGKVSPLAAMVAGGSAAVFLVLLLMPLAPQTTSLKIMATYGMALGLLLQIAVRTHMQMRMNRRLALQINLTRAEPTLAFVCPPKPLS